jgi:hypothetical protein
MLQTLESIRIETDKCKIVSVHAVKAYGGEQKYSLCPFLTSALYGDEWSTSRP